MNMYINQNVQMNDCYCDKNLPIFLIQTNNLMVFYKRHSNQMIESSFKHQTEKSKFVKLFNH